MMRHPAVANPRAATSQASPIHVTEKPSRSLPVPVKGLRTHEFFRKTGS
jgi:hypothetical protein